MNDVVRPIMLAVGDVDLGAENSVGAIRLRLGTGFDQRQIRAGLGFGQVHCAGPLAAHHFFNVRGFKCVRTRQQDRLNRALGEHRHQAKAHVRGMQHFVSQTDDRTR